MNLVITVPANVLAHNGARASAVTLLTTVMISSKFHWLSMLLYDLYNGLYNIIRISLPAEMTQLH